MPALSATDLAPAAFTAPKAADITKAPGFHSGLNAIYGPGQTVEFLNGLLEAKGIVGERVETEVVRDDGSVIKGHFYRYGGQKAAQQIAAE